MGIPSLLWLARVLDAHEEKDERERAVAALRQEIPDFDARVEKERAKASVKVEAAKTHAINCGLMLLQVKASLAHGQWLPWLKSQQESGAIEFTDRTAQKYLKLAANTNHGSYFIEAPSIRAALELLTEDKTASDQQAGLELETANDDFRICGIHCGLVLGDQPSPIGERPIIPMV